jgi:hypothetical protein
MMQYANDDVPLPLARQASEEAYLAGGTSSFTYCIICRGG